MKIGIVNFNVDQLTNACIKSIIKKLKFTDYHIMIVDNSDKNRKFKLDPEIDKSLITVFDNTNGNLIDIDGLV